MRARKLTFIRTRIQFTLRDNQNVIRHANVSTTAGIVACKPLRIRKRLACPFGHRNLSRKRGFPFAKRSGQIDGGRDSFAVAPCLLRF